MLQAIKIIHYEVYYWSRVDEAIISHILLQDVWIVNNEKFDYDYFHYDSLVCF